MAGNGYSSLLAQRLARFPSLDPGAVRAVAGQEGLGGGIGDGGHAFGPFQLNDAGGVITGKFPGWTVQQKQAWAWSPAGIDYALSGINRVAAGKRGPDAVSSIVSGFERPADIPGETSRALASLGSVTNAAAVGGSTNVGSYAPQPSQALTAAPSVVPVGPSPAEQRVSGLGQQLSLHLVNAAQSLLGGGTPDLKSLFAAAAGFQQARQQLTRTAPLGGSSALAAKAGAI